MTTFDATEAAYKNGYAAGIKEKLEYIDCLQKRCEELKKERDAAVTDLKKVSNCVTCKHTTEMDDDLCMKCARSFGLKYEWRGLSLAEKISDKEEKE